MIVYRDMISGDEMLSDAFTLKPVVEADGTVVKLLYTVLYDNLKLTYLNHDDSHSWYDCDDDDDDDDDYLLGGGLDVCRVEEYRQGWWWNWYWMW